MDRREEARQKVGDFVRESELSMCEDNRWVMRALTIPWDALRAELAPGDDGSFRMLLAACLVEAQLGLSDEETLIQIVESPYLQFFCGLPRYSSTGLPVDGERLRRFRESMSEDKLQRIAEVVKAGE